MLNTETRAPVKKADLCPSGFIRTAVCPHSQGTSANTDLKDEPLYPFSQVFLIKSLYIIKHLDILSRFWFHKLSTLSNFRLLKHSYLDISYEGKCSAVNIGCFVDLPNIQCLPRFLRGEQMIHFNVLSATSHISSALAPSLYFYTHFNKWQAHCTWLECPH